MSLVTGLFFLVILLNQQWFPSLRIQASHCSTFRIMCDVPSIAVFCSESILLLLLLLLLLFNRRYNPWLVLACFTISFHNLLSLHFSLPFLTFIFFRSSSTWSSHLSLRLSTGLDKRGSHSVTFLTILVVSILTTCAAHRTLCDFINLTIFFFLIRISNSSFVFTLHVPSLSDVGPYIFLSTLLSKTSRRFYAWIIPAVNSLNCYHLQTGLEKNKYISPLLRLRTKTDRISGKKYQSPETQLIPTSMVWNSGRRLNILNENFLSPPPPPVPHKWWYSAVQYNTAISHALPWLRRFINGHSPRLARSMSDLWWTSWLWDGFFSEYFQLSVLKSFHQNTMFLFHLSTTHFIQY